MWPAGGSTSAWSGPEAIALPFPTGAFTLAGFITFEVWMHVELGLDDGVLTLLDEIDEISARHGFDQWAIVASTQREVSNALRAIDRGDDPAEILRLGHTLGGYLAMWKTMDQWVFLTYYTTCQGRLFAEAGEREGPPPSRSRWPSVSAPGCASTTRRRCATSWSYKTTLRSAWRRWRPLSRCERAGGRGHRAACPGPPPPRDRRRCPAARRGGAVPGVGQLRGARPRPGAGERQGLKTGPA